MDPVDKHCKEKKLKHALFSDQNTHKLPYVEQALAIRTQATDIFIKNNTGFIPLKLAQENTMPFQPNTTGSILDSIKESTTNIEAFANNTTTNNAIYNALREISLKERATREATIVITATQSLNHASIIELIKSEWSDKREQPCPIFWQDKQNAYVQFLNTGTKNDFTREATTPNGPLSALKDLINKPNLEGHQFTRKPIRVEIQNARSTIKAAEVDKTLRKAARPYAAITSVREGKLHGQPGRQARSLMMTINSEGFKTVFQDMQGAIPYYNTATNAKITLYPKINAKPWACRDCYYIGPNHECQGKACGRCGNRGHITKECKEVTRFCTNCKRGGHMAKDSHCPTYIREVGKELKRMDIPLEYLEDKDKRFELTKYITYK